MARWHPLPRERGQPCSTRSGSGFSIGLHRCLLKSETLLPIVSRAIMKGAATSGGGGVDLCKRGHETALLCQCECHFRCPVASVAPIANSEWDSRCTCAGATRRRLLEQDVRRGSEQRKSHIREVMGTIDVSPGRKETDLRADLDIALRERGVDMSPQELNVHAKTLAIRTGPKHLQPLRVAGLFASMIRGVIEIIHSDDGGESRPA